MGQFSIRNSVKLHSVRGLGQGLCANHAFYFRNPPLNSLKEEITQSVWLSLIDLDIIEMDSFIILDDFCV